MAMEFAEFARQMYFEELRKKCLIIFHQIWAERCSEAEFALKSDGITSSGEIKPIHYISNGISVRINRIADSKFRVFVPAGLFDRLYLLVYLNLSEHTIGRGIHVVKSVTDINDFDPFIPERLRPLFGDSEIDCSKYSSALVEKYCLAPPHPSSVEFVLYSAFTFIAVHEISHITKGHFEIRDQFLKKEGARYIYARGEALGFTETELLMGFECNADNAAALSLSKLLSETAVTLKKQKLDFELAFLDGFVGIGLLFSILDWRFRSLDKRGEGYYPHPLIRWSLVTKTIETCIDQEWKEYVKSYSDAVGKGISNFLNGLSLSETLDSDEGFKDEDTDRLSPIGQLNMPISEFNLSVLSEFVYSANEKSKRIDMLKSGIEVTKTIKAAMLKMAEET
jgi:hypothetical protein